ncbi:capping complex subunit for YIEGIA [Bacillus subtilis]|uniref:Capping complex subunit for YIEGIA n=1 Tax=Bacillus subtilis TaxID=1423 RepID=A0AC61Z1D0_BACIU|nr:hypothetical protein P5634_12465 [Bacillus subtilis]WGE06730.1 hypothetical protein P5658_15265 [Bacillus subtilis]
MSESLTKVILTVITTNPNRAAGGAPVFFCNDQKEMELFAKNLEAILDGIAHRIGDDVYLIVKHF